MMRSPSADAKSITDIKIYQLKDLTPEQYRHLYDTTFPSTTYKDSSKVDTHIKPHLTLVESIPRNSDTYTPTVQVSMFHDADARREDDRSFHNTPST